MFSDRKKMQSFSLRLSQWYLLFWRNFGTNFLHNRFSSLKLDRCSFTVPPRLFSKAAVCQLFERFCCKFPTFLGITVLISASTFLFYFFIFVQTFVASFLYLFKPSKWKREFFLLSKTGYRTFELYTIILETITSYVYILTPFIRQ